MKVLFLGGASSVGASCIAVELANQWVVVDAGVRVDRKSDRLPDLALLQDKTVSAILVTHAHADHIGALPLLHQAYPYTPIYASRATGLLMQIMLADAQRVMERRAVEEMEIPLYSPSLVNSMLQQIRTLPPDPSELPGLPGIIVHTSRAGHIAGALSVGLVAPEASIVVSGDLSLTQQRTVLGAVPPSLERPDLLVLESTYGAKLHPNRQEEERRLAEAVASGIERGGHVLIPCFGLGRGQELLLLLQAAQEQGVIRPFPIYVDGLVRKVCSAYTLLPEALNPRLARQLRRGYQPFEGPFVSFVREPQERQQILQGPPSCILTSSGMLTGGPSAWYAERLVTDPNASILFSGYLDGESPGRRLLDLAEGKRDTIEVGGSQVLVACTIEKYSLSAHADGGELAAYAAKLRPRRVALVHGDGESRQALRRLLDETEVLLPQNGETIDLVSPRGAPHPPGQSPISQEMLPYGVGGDKLFSAENLKALWRALSHIPDYQAITLRDLVSVWYGGLAQDEHFLWMEQVLEEEQPYDEPYFLPHPDLPEAYHVRRTQQDSREEVVSRLVGQVVLLRTNPGAAKPALCRAIEPQGTMRVLHPRGEYNGQTHFSLRILLDVVGRLPYDEQRNERAVLTEAVKTARRIRKKFSAHELARACEETASYTLTDLCELLELPTHDLPTRLAVAKLLQQHPRLFANREPALEGTGYARYGLAPTFQAGLNEPEVRERPDQAWILSVVERHLGSPADLVRASVNNDTGDVTLTFFFPEAAKRRYRAAVDAVAEEAEVSVTIASQTHQGALEQAARRHLPASLFPEEHPSVFVERRTVRIVCAGEASSEQIAEACEHFYQETLWRLDVQLPHVQASSPPAVSHAEAKASPPSPVAPSASTLSQQEVLERARAILRPLAGFQKVGLDPDLQILRVRFDFPDVASSRYAQELAHLEDETGRSVQLHPTARQEALLEQARQVLPVGLTITNAPSVYWDKHTVEVLCTGTADGRAMEDARQRFTEQTGWRLDIRLLAPQEASRLSQAQALAYADGLLRSTRRLSQVSVDAERGALLLRYQFPEMARERYADLFAELSKQTGWRVELQPRTDLNALASVAQQMLPASLQVQGKISYYQERCVMRLVCSGEASDEEVELAKRQFSVETGWTLEVRFSEAPK